MAMPAKAKGLQQIAGNWGTDLPRGISLPMITSDRSGRRTYVKAAYRVVPVHVTCYSFRENAEDDLLSFRLYSGKILATDGSEG
jgi:hypothetical protein